MLSPGSLYDILYGNFQYFDIVGLHVGHLQGYGGMRQYPL